MLKQVAALCGIMLLATPEASAVKSDQPEVPLGDLLCRLEKVTDTEAETSSQKRGIACIF